MDITKIIESVITLAVAIITAFVIPYIKGKMNANQLAILKVWVNVAVQAAEQLFSTEQGKEKKEYVEKFIAEKGFVVDYDSLNNLIESAVLELHKELYG